MHQPWRTFAAIIDRKARKYKKVASPSRKLSPVKEAEPVKKGKRVKRPAKKSTTAPTIGVAIRDTPGVSAPKKKAHAKADRSKGIEILSDIALSKASQLKEAIKRSKKDYHISQASGSGNGTDFESGVPNELQRKTSGSDEGANDHDDDSNDESKGDDDKADSDDNGNSDADDNERTDSDDDDENPSFTLKDHDKENMMKSNVSQEKSYEQVVKDAHVTLTSSQKTAVDEVASMMNVKNRQEESSTQAPFLFTMPKTAIPDTSTVHATIVPPIISMITPFATTNNTISCTNNRSNYNLNSCISGFFLLFGFDQRVSTLETELCQLKQADHSAQLLESVKSQLPTMVDDLLSTRIGYATRTDLEFYTKDF
nr:hypothetical protein [Tanacetum cinerariifolium]